MSCIMVTTEIVDLHCLCTYAGGVTDLTTCMGLTKQRDRARVAGIEGDDLELNRNDQRGLLQVTAVLCNPVRLITLSLCRSTKQEGR